MTALERYQAPENPVIADNRYMDRIPTMAEMFARSNLCPEQFRGKSADVAIIAYSLADLGLRLSMNTLPQCYVVHGKPDYMTQLKAAIASRWGYDVRPIEEQCTPDSATVRITTPEGEIHEVTFTMDEAKKGGLVAQNPLYNKWPKEMLKNRAASRAIKYHAPEVMLGLSSVGVPVDETPAPAPERPSAAVSVAIAKTRLVEAFMKDYDEDRAVELARELWQAHGLGKDPISSDELDELLAEARAPRIEDAEVIEDGEPFE